MTLRIPLVRLLVLSLVAGPVLLAVPSGARAQTETPAPSPIRGTQLFFRNIGTAISMDKNAELTYNPYYAMELGFAARWWFWKHLYLLADVDVSREITNADDTTRQGEYWWGDVRGGFGGSAPPIPWVGIVVSGRVSAYLPTSKLSKARTLLVSLRPELSISRRFDLLHGITLSYGLQVTRNFHEYTTSQRELPLVPGCEGSDCARFLNFGYRNSAWRLTNLAALSVDFFDWLGISADAAVVVDYLYPSRAGDERVSYEPQKPTDERYLMVYGLELYGQPMDSLSLAVGAVTANPQLAPDSSLEKPFFNRYTQLYFDVRFNIDGFVAQLTSTGEEK